MCLHTTIMCRHCPIVWHCNWQKSEIKDLLAIFLCQNPLPISALATSVLSDFLSLTSLSLSNLQNRVICIDGSVTCQDLTNFPLNIYSWHFAHWTFISWQISSKWKLTLILHRNNLHLEFVGVWQFVRSIMSNIWCLITYLDRFAKIYKFKV